MPRVAICRNQLLKIGIPLWVYVDENPVAMMTGREVALQMPMGEYDLSVRMVFQLGKRQLRIGGSRRVALAPGKDLQITLSDKERWWNILFDIDLVVWLLGFFFKLTTPWNVVYHVLSDGFFAVWLLRIWMIRERYYILKTN